MKGAENLLCSEHGEFFVTSFIRDELGKRTTLLECGKGCSRKFIVDGCSYKYEASKDGVVTESIRANGNKKANR